MLLTFLSYQIFNVCNAKSCKESRVNLSIFEAPGNNDFSKVSTSILEILSNLALF
jgi:hypothetical protein